MPIHAYTLLLVSQLHGPDDFALIAQSCWTVAHCLEELSIF